MLQEFIFTINVECLQRNLLAQLLMHNCAPAKHAETSKYNTQRILQTQSSGK